MKAPDKKSIRIMFVCEGNTCRSPMAEVVLRATIPENLVDDVEIVSAGLKASTGQPATEKAELVCRMKGYDLSGHRSQQVTEVLLNTSDLIFCMEPGQMQHIREKYPHLDSRVHTLRGFSEGLEKMIEDPFKQEIKKYIKTLDMIIEEINGVLPCLLLLFHHFG